MEITCKTTDFLKLRTEISGKGNFFRFYARGYSMQPLIMNGEVIRVTSINRLDIKIGDILFYRASWGGIAAHRVIKKNRENNKLVLVTKGDANLNFDTPVHEDDIIGKVIAIEKHSGTIKLDCKIWRIANYMIASYSLLTLSIYSRISFLKIVLIGNRKNRVISFYSKVLITSFLFSQKSLLNFLLFVCSIGLKVKS